MRPPRSDIAAPELPPGLVWTAEPPHSMAALTATGPVIVEFIDFAQLNSVRALPYVVEWERRYSDMGLSVIGVQAPRFAFGFDPATVAAGLERLGAGFPVAIDAERRLWLAYGCEVWPSLFLWGQGGALRWVHFGEGEYAATEEAIQAELREADALREMPEPLAPLRATDGPGVRVMPPSPEVFPAEGRAWTAADGPFLDLSYAAGGVHATLEGSGEVGVKLDGGEARSVEVRRAGLYELASHPRHEAHSLRISVPEGVGVWSVSFAPGVPG